MECNICGGQTFKDRRGRKNAQCSDCGSWERHRAAWAVIKGRWMGKLLHFAPERCIRRLLESQCELRTTADKYRTRVDYQCDIQALPFDSVTYDTIFCSHVLEHVDNDMQALREMRRVLKADGWACIVIPVYPGKTMVRAEWTGKPKAFGQANHVRRYGDDAGQRMAKVFGKVEVYGGRVFICQGTAGPQGGVVVADACILGQL